MRTNRHDRTARFRALKLAITLGLIAAVSSPGGEVDLPNPLLITDEMKHWVERRVFAGQSDSLRARNLMLALNGLNLQYQLGNTGTAADVFTSKKFNCVSFSFLFVGLARHLGLQTHFLRAIDDPGYSREGELVVVNEHMTAGLRDGVQDRVLEFRFLPDPANHRFQLLEDEEAIALYYSNLGAERLFQGDPVSAAAYFERATEKKPDFPELWVNLGVARRRAGDHAAAEAAYMQALEVDPGDSRAYLNLASLMWRRGDINATDRLMKLLEQGNPRDPHAYLVLGDHALRGRRHDDAERFYKRAIRKDRSSGEARAALGLLLLERGEAKKAKKQLLRAQKKDGDHPRTQELERAMKARTDIENRVDGS